MKRRTFIKQSMILATTPVMVNSASSSAEPTIKFRLIRNATVLLELGHTKILVDPLFSKKFEIDPVPWSNEIRNPTVELPISEAELSELVNSTDLVLVTHTHRDHWDPRAQQLIPKDKYIICQLEDEEKIRQQGFTHLDTRFETSYRDISFIKVGAQHGHGELMEKMAPVTGFIIKWSGKTIYLAGDSVWSKIVAMNINSYQPDYIIVNAGAAQFNFGEPITMTIEDVLQVAKNSKTSSKIVVVHMEAINHCAMKRDDLKKALQENGYSKRVWVPDDGQYIQLA
jgi:L-ascorbate metabolism protein UlaG (beta-lactamase superfamily)